MSSGNGNNNKNIILNDYEEITSIFPDTIVLDSSDLTSEFSDGDTIDMYTIGADTIYTIFIDTLTATSGLYFRYEASPMKILLSNQTFEVQEGLLGLNITDIFEIGHANEYEDLPKYAIGENPCDYLSELCPATLRVFSGQGSRFMELLGSARTALNDPFNVSATMMNGGYGFCMERIIPFYDGTDDDGVGDAPPLFDDTPNAPPISIWDDMNDLDGGLDPLSTWLYVY